MYAKRYIDIKKAEQKAKKEREKKNKEFKPIFKSKYNKNH